VVSTNKETIAFLLEQLEPLNVAAKAMFGEYGLYCDGKIVALVCDDTLFLKPSAGSDGLGLPEAPAYHGSKDYRVVDADLLEASERLRALIQATADALPAPKPKRPKRLKTGG